jgi:hypothetical protein
MISTRNLIIGIVTIVAIAVFVYLFIIRKHLQENLVILLKGRDYEKDNLSCKSNDPKARSQLITYLSAVYPVAEERFKTMSTNDLNTFYNSLWFYYNCEYSGEVVLEKDKKEDNNSVYSKGDKVVQDKTTLCWSKVCDTKLPYAPTGVVYSFDTWWKGSQPMIVSDSDNDLEKLGGSIPGQTFIANKMGPAPVWQYARAIFRNIYVPSEYKDKKVPYVLKGDVCQLNPPFKQPSNWWYGVESYGFMEVNGASEPGLGMSCCPTWYDGWIGSGLFLNVGKTLIARNKSNAVYRLAEQMVLQGHENQLLKWFNAANPLEVLYNIYNCKIESPKFNIGGKVMNYDICSSGRSVTNSGRIPEPNKNWGDFVKANDMKAWCGSENIEECLHDMMFGGSYNADRLNTTTVWDEPIFAMGSFLDYDTVQMVVSANTNGYWQYEILELRYAKDIEGVKNRNYSNFISGPADIGSAFDLYFEEKFLSKYMNLIPSFLSLRDPFDLRNWKMCDFYSWEESQNISPDWEKNKTINTVCKNNMSNVFAKLALSDCNPTCAENTKC